MDLRKNTLALIGILSLFLLPCLTSPSYSVITESKPRGDVNLDRQLTLADVILALQGVVGLRILEGQSLENTDMDLDQKATLRDVLILLRVVLKANPPGLPPRGSRVVLAPPPPAPTPVRRSTVEEVNVEIFAQGLEVPWDIAFLPDGRILVTERPGRIRLIVNGALKTDPYWTIPARGLGEGGLMGITLHPDFPRSPYIYVMYTRQEGLRTFNRVSRLTDRGDRAEKEEVIIDQIPGAFIHDGGILRFGPDGMLYVGTGDSAVPERAQDLFSLAGKILRVTPEGNIPLDNPFPGSPIYALGFRNVQGLAWNPATGDLWCTNHGPSGELSGITARDSIFIVERGGNHGWPRVLGAADLPGVVNPILHFPGTSVPPAGCIFYTGTLFPESFRGNFFFASLAGSHLQRVILNGPRSIARIERWWETGVHSGVYGRLRAVVQGPDGALYITTSNRDGRGTVRAGDDKILRITPK